MKTKIYIAVALLVFFALIVSPFFVKVGVVCKTQYGVCTDELNQKTTSHSGESLFNANRKISKELKSNFLVSDFSLQYKLPNTLLVNILVKKPDFALINESSGEVSLVDSEGSVLTNVKETGLPKVIVTHPVPKPGEKVTDNDLSALRIAIGVFNMYQVMDSRLEDETLTVDLPGGIRVLFPLGEDSQVLLGSLRLIYTRITSGDLVGKYSQIDLRFKNPVLR